MKMLNISYQEKDIPKRYSFATWQWKREALYLHYFNNQPPRTHNLDFLIQAIPGGVPERFEDLVDLLEDKRVKVRYPPVLDLLFLRSLQI